MLAITRALTLLYTLSLLTLLTRIQLNLLGRRTYLSSVVSLASPPTKSIVLENNDDNDNYDNVYGNDFETNRQYLTFSWWLLHRGCKEMTEKVTTAVKEVFGPVNPREDITLERLSMLILEVRKKIEGATELERREHKWLPFLLPPKEEEDAILRGEHGASASQSPAPQDSTRDPLENESQKTVDHNPSLRRLLDETSDLIDSPTFTHVLTLLLNTAFSHLIDQRIATEAFKVTTIDSTSRVTDVTDRKCKVAQTLAVFCRQAHIIAAGSGEIDELSIAAGQSPNEYLAAIDQVKDLEGFAAVVYSSNFEFETAQQEEEMEVIADDMAVEAKAIAKQVEVENRKDERLASVTVEVPMEDSKPSENTLDESEVILGDVTDEVAQGEEHHNTDSLPEVSGGPSFENAWQRALQVEDGVKPEDAT